MINNVKYKNNHSVLVVIYCEQTHEVLMLQRSDDPDFWQSVTGSLEENESPYETAIREVYEETGIDIVKEKLLLFDCNQKVEFEIFPKFRYKYAPNTKYATEHWFLLALPNKWTPKLTEHIDFRWVSAKDAQLLTKSWNNRLAIEKYLLN